MNELLPPPLPSHPTPRLITPETLHQPGTQLIDFPELTTPLLFTRPDTLLIARTPDTVRPILRQVEAATRSGCWVAGLLSYEAAAGFDLPVFSRSAAPDGPPLAWFAVYTTPPQPVCYPPSTPLPPVRITPCIDQTRFRQDLAAIAIWIAAGETYQVNHTLEARLEGETDLAELFLGLQAAHRFPKAMWIQADGWSVASFSPELFLERRGQLLVTAPIKGTRPRSQDPKVDLERLEALKQSEKDQAEHVMIVDMARNDLGQVCETGSVRVEHLAMPRSFSTVHHLETRVHGQLRPDVDLEKILAALFPAASITGAPKRATMERIVQREDRARGVYTGAMGVLQPNGDLWLNVAIRTVVQTARNGWRIGLGGGVVADSNAEAEWAEVADKARFLTEMPEPLTLIETFRVEAGGAIPWLDRHLMRLTSSAKQLGMPLEPTEVAERIRQAARTWARNEPTPLTGRLELIASGQIRLTRRAFTPWPKTGLRVRLADWQPDPLDPLIGHKSNRRLHLEAEWHQAKKMGYDEVLFINRRAQVTEGAISALIVRHEGRWYAPSLDAGLCPSLWRTAKIPEHQVTIRSLTLEDLKKAEEILMGNAVREGCAVKRIENFCGQIIYIDHNSS
ncbi:MAG: chorismate-binding protein [Magnetococcus sp. YQC-9]